jgi:hypothetical protein
MTSNTVHSHRRRTLIAGSALGTMLALGGAAGLSGLGGVAGAATTTPTAAQCAKAQKVEARVAARESKFTNTTLPKMEARESKATSSNHPKVAARIAKRIDRIKKLEARVSARLAKIEAKCGTSGSTGSTAS